MNRKIKLGKQQKGFTIIEVLIVLAIAGLIVLIVFLAVPALQRNSRNTQRKNDVSAVMGAIQEHVNNNSGKLPESDDYTRVKENAKISFYDSGSITLSTQNSNYPSPNTSSITEDSVLVVNNARCDGNDPTGENASRRSVIALFKVETSGDPELQCQEL